MKMIFLWAIFTFIVAFKAKKVDRWLVMGYVALCFGNIVFAYLGF